MCDRSELLTGQDECCVCWRLRSTAQSSSSSEKDDSILRRVGIRLTVMHLFLNAVPF